ncbi:hypothetical protein MRS44_003905 [Fusarium solani]|uniref:uncharacterized protein n=1 Tax=Fusarium solani TaxID=169388 RepID=UPI0032C4A431|nr:hypothetical protein MRS44_003905 [Fusarium solani]
MNSQLFDLTQWDQDDLDFSTPHLSSDGSPTTSPARLTPSRSYPRTGLPLLQLADWDSEVAYDESPPTCIHYSIEWKLQLRKGRLTKLTNDTERDLVLAPGAYWDRTLESKVEGLLRKKTPQGKCYLPEETNVIVSVTDRSERDLTKRFDEFNIDWRLVEGQLSDWSHLFQMGKKLRIDMSFICKEEAQQGSATVLQGNRGSATSRQLAERDQLLETQEAEGRPRVWNDVYNLMRCKKDSCPGSYCFVGEQRRHIVLNTNILTKMVQYAEQGNVLETHRDVPAYILDMIYEKDTEDSERRQKRKAPGLESDRPIKIVNILPSPYGQPNAEGCTPPASSFPHASHSAFHLTDLVIPTPIDKSIDIYTEWNCDQVDDENWKDGFRRAGSITKHDCLDLRHVYQDQDVAYYVDKGVKPGIARSWVQGIKAWADEQ